MEGLGEAGHQDRLSLGQEGCGGSGGRGRRLPVNRENMAARFGFPEMQGSGGRSPPEKFLKGSQKPLKFVTRNLCKP